MVHDLEWELEAWHRAARWLREGELRGAKAACARKRVIYRKEWLSHNVEETVCDELEEI